MISGKGGANGGNGGFAEVSSRGMLSVDGSVDLSAAGGRFGQFLIEPAGDMVVAAAEVAVAELDDAIGWLAQSGRVPLGYLGDAETTRTAFTRVGDLVLTATGWPRPPSCQG